jgi:hypothetical protein
MYDGSKIIPGLIIFVLLVSFPVWYNHGDAGEAPVLEMPKDGLQCILPAAEMRPKHMQLLNEWRDDALRRGEREFTVKVGDQMFQKGLTITCMECHSSFQRFCNECHDYVAVKVYCWECHVAPVD